MTQGDSFSVLLCEMRGGRFYAAESPLKDAVAIIKGNDGIIRVKLFPECFLP